MTIVPGSALGVTPRDGGDGPGGTGQSGGAGDEPALAPIQQAEFSGKHRAVDPLTGITRLSPLPEVLVCPEISAEELENGTALAKLLDILGTHEPQGDFQPIKHAYNLGVEAHRGQRRRSGEPYFVHPVRVARVLAQLGLDSATVTAALLHDVVEDTELTVYHLTEQFGREVATIVDGVTKLGKVPYLSRQEQQAESFRKMLLAMSQDIRVLLVKLIDRLDNMRTLGALPREKQERISRETMQIYTPLAGRLGIEVVQRELQDLSFAYLEPAARAAIVEDMARELGDGAAVEDSLKGLQGMFQAAPGPGVSGSELTIEDARWQDSWGPVQVRARLRSPYRVSRATVAAGRGVDQLSDVASFHIITRDRAACYAALGLLHAHFQPVPGRFRDYVALPRPNRYRALHTTVINRAGLRLEVQIRSQAMDAVAERGIIADWGPDSRQGSEARRLAWLNQLMDWQRQVSDPSEFIEAVKADLFADEVYVFTPQGDIETFPKGSTPIDFAFAIHTDVGMHCTGARVNGQLVPLRYRMRQGDTVEILTSAAVEPREEWLRMCVTSRARAKIKHFLRQRERRRLRGLGHSLVEQEFAGRELELSAYETPGRIAEQAEALGLPRETTDDGIYEAIGAGQITAGALADRLVPASPPTGDDGSLLTRMLRRMTVRSRGHTGEAQGGKPAAPIIVNRERIEGRGSDVGMVALASCCSPVPGDALVGFFEAGHGIVAHVEGCPEILDQLGGRRVHLAWDPELVLDCPVTLEVRTANTLGLLAEMSRAFSHHGVNIKQANCRAVGDGVRAVNTFYASVGRLDQLQSLIATLKRTEGVTSVERVFAHGGAGSRAGH